MPQENNPYESPEAELKREEARAHLNAIKTYVEILDRVLNKKPFAARTWDIADDLRIHANRLAEVTAWDPALGKVPPPALVQVAVDLVVANEDSWVWDSDWHWGSVFEAELFCDPDAWLDLKRAWKAGAEPLVRVAEPKLRPRAARAGDVAQHDWQTDVERDSFGREYPTDEDIERIEKWDMTAKDEPFGVYGLIDYVRRLWHMASWGFKWSKDLRTLEPHTGGWSGNEQIIAALERNYCFWGVCWERSECGGHYYFTIPHTLNGRQAFIQSKFSDAAR